LLLLLDLRPEVFSSSRTYYHDITLLSFEENTVSMFNSIRNIEAPLLDEVAATELQLPVTAEETPSFQLLNRVAAVEEYEDLIQLLHTRKTTSDL